MSKKVKSKRWLAALFAVPAASVFPLSSCGLNQPWSFEVSTKNATVINYCLLIGQNDHTDSIERTRWTRSALGTLDKSEATKKITKDNPNIAKPVTGILEFKNPKTQKKNTFVVNEIEQMEQKSMAGSPWDSIMANNTASTWIAKHGHNITFFVSNNDAMAEGAMWASNWIKGMPIFGYDANATTLQWINSGQITGTIDQNASTQMGTAAMIFRNCLEDRDNYWKDYKFDSTKAHGFGTKEYNPSKWRGFIGVNNDGVQPSNDVDLSYGYVNLNLISHIEIQSGDQRQILSESTPIAHLKGDKYLDNIHDYIKPDGNAKEPKDLFDAFTKIQPVKPTTHYNILQTYCNRAEAFLMSTLKPYFNEYANRLSLDLDIVEGDGSGEELVINQIRSRTDKYDGFFINMSKTTSTLQYVLDLAQKAYNYEYKKIGKEKEAKFGKKWEWSKDPNWTGWDDWDLRLDTPLIFFNRQPHLDSGEVDYSIMNNKFFKYTYFIGADSLAGGVAQGSLITAAIEHWFDEWAMKQ